MLSTFRGRGTIFIALWILIALTSPNAQAENEIRVHVEQLTHGTRHYFFG